MQRILIADDNEQLVRILSDAARSEGFQPVSAKNGKEALDQFHSSSPAVVLLDVMMPEMDGFQVCRLIRKESLVPILMITARSEDFEKIMGLDIGADDYIVKPFSPAEVMARVRAVLRRIDRDSAVKQMGTVLTIGSLSINLNTYRVQINGINITLTKREIDVLWTLAANRDRAFTRDMLLDQLWGIDYYGDPRMVDSHIKRLRAKLDAAEHPDWEIRTIRNVGYKFEELNI